ncbi:uncharacterized protein N7459_000007 [Penicillium hispanicum]|uniref:uncharacterized protein n=1 Tax=Penicillium hispanicum TaxID=1080232 RepID=UPI002540998E|nr:uncharacterized protein N7459_000007 [Penicillium hispanicum]KAJ5593799.1 hypothetical protein N7459_000007 [Penicillium hispanicum]
MRASQVVIPVQTARQCEHAEALHIRRQAEVCTQLYPEQEIVIRLGPRGGVTIRTLAIFEGKLNRAVGYGPDRALRADEVEEIESIFAPIGLGPQIHLSPFALPSTLQTLFRRGYVERGILSTYWYPLERPTDAHVLAVETQKVASSETQRFIEASVAGFQDNGRSHDLLRALAEIATRREDTALYFALVDGAIAGSAALASIETPEGSVAHLYLDSTILAYRGRGVHRALIHARLSDAHRRGLSLATMITSMGDGSARNAERAGMSLAYTIPIVSGPRP